MSTATKSQAERVYEVVVDDPGVNVAHIQERLTDLTNKQISNSLAFLRSTDRIVNLGRHSRGASWFPKDGK